MAAEEPPEKKEVKTIRWGMITTTPALPFDQEQMADAVTCMRNVTKAEIARRWVICTSSALATAGITATLLRYNVDFAWFAFTMPSNFLAAAFFNSARNNV